MNENKDMNASNTFYLKHNQEIDVEYFQKKAREKNTIQIQIIEIDDKTSKLHKTIISAT